MKAKRSTNSPVPSIPDAPETDRVRERLEQVQLAALDHIERMLKGGSHEVRTQTAQKLLQFSMSRVSRDDQQKEDENVKLMAEMREMLAEMNDDTADDSEGS